MLSFCLCFAHLHYIIKSILIHEYQHESTRINTGPTRVDTSQHKSTRVQHEQHESDTSQHDYNTNQHEAARVQNRSRPWKREKYG